MKLIELFLTKEGRTINKCVLEYLLIVSSYHRSIGAYIRFTTLFINWSDLSGFHRLGKADLDIDKLIRIFRSVTKAVSTRVFHEQTRHLVITACRFTRTKGHIYQR